MQTDLLLQGAQLAVTSATGPGHAAGAPSDGGLSFGTGPGAGLPVIAELPFSGVLTEAMTNLRQLESQASNSIQGLIGGQGVDVHQAMIATQKSDLAFEMALAVRGKAVAAYQALMGVQF